MTYRDRSPMVRAIDQIACETRTLDAIERYDVREYADVGELPVGERLAVVRLMTQERTR